ncbi:MAG: cytidylate kinase-like family protein, partial [Lachnospiraceae bacterium]|nr:cytidylate kinase-like family protein [Lachnospiraceae bacterium]
MDKMVITIARQYGSGGKTIGQMLAKDLGIKAYSREILKLASEDSGINETLFNQVDEKLKTTPLFRIMKKEYKGELIPPESEDFLSNQNLFNYQAKVIKDLAEEDSCVIIGRCADFVLKDKPNVIRVFVHASPEYCLKQAVERGAH